MAQLNQARVIEPVIRACYNGSGSPIAKGTIVKLLTVAPVYPDQVVKAAAATDVLFGVAMNDIPNGEFGDVQIGGTALVLVGAAGLVAAAQVTSDGSGLAIAASTGNSLLGVSGNNSAAASGDYVEVEINAVGGTAR